MYYIMQHTIYGIPLRHGLRPGRHVCRCQEECQVGGCMCTPSLPIESFPIKSPRVELSGRP